MKNLTPEQIEIISAALKNSLPYVEGAYECAFPDSDENLSIAESLRKAIQIVSE